jgi:polyhydroxyalkanoate synthesis regulator phasin
MIEAPKSERKKEKIEEGIFSRFLRIKGELAKILGTFLILSSLHSEVEAKNFSSELEKALRPNQKIEIKTEMPEHLRNMEEVIEKVAETSYVQASREMFETQRDALELTRRFNDIKAIKEFLKPDSPIGIDEFHALTIDSPSRFNFGPLVKRRYLNLFINTRMNWMPNLEALRRGLPGDRYEIKSLVVRVIVQEERSLGVEILRSILSKEAERRGLRRDIIDSILGRLGFRLSALATIEINLYNWNTGQYLNLIGFGAPRPIGPLFVPFDRELAIQEAINNGFDNLETLLKEALAGRVIVVAGRAFIISQ